MHLVANGMCAHWHHKNGKARTTSTSQGEKWPKQAGRCVSGEAMNVHLRHFLISIPIPKICFITSWIRSISCVLNCSRQIRKLSSLAQEWSLMQCLQNENTESSEINEQCSCAHGHQKYCQVAHVSQSLSCRHSHLHVHVNARTHTHTHTHTHTLKV